MIYVYYILQYMSIGNNGLKDLQIEVEINYRLLLSNNLLLILSRVKMTCLDKDKNKFYFLLVDIKLCGFVF